MNRKALLLALIALVLPAHGQITKLADLSPSVGAAPRGTVLEMGGNFYFTCSAGGLFNHGTISVYVPGSGVFKLADLYGPSTGAAPLGGLLAVGNQLYFTCSSGGSSNYGTLSALDLVSGSVAVVTHMTPSTGQNPQGSVTAHGGFLYFTCLNSGSYYGGGVYAGTVQKIHPTTGQVTTYWIDYYTGAMPYGGLTPVGTDLYFTCAWNTGPLCKLDTLAGTISKVTDVNSSVGPSPQGDVLAIGSDLYFTAMSGGASYAGAILRYSLATSTLTKLADLNSGPGSSPHGGLVNDAGLLYFTTEAGAAHGQGGLSLYNGIAQSIGPCDNTLGFNARSTPIIAGGQVVFTCASGGANSAGTLVSMPRMAHAQGTVIGQGCGAGFTPVLTAPGVPKLGQTLTVALSGAPPLTPGGYVYSGIPSTDTPISPGCTVYVDLATFAEFGTLFTTPFGAHSLTYPLPPSPQCSGALVRVQAYVITPTLWQGFGLSNGLELTLGY